MDKREFIKAGAASGIGFAAGVVPGVAAAANVPMKLSVDALSELRAAVPSQQAQSILSQVELIMQATGSARDRAMFVADPVGYAHQRGVDIDPGFALVMRDEMRKVEANAASAINQARVGAAAKITASEATAALPIVMAAAAVVSAVAAVVSAVSLTYVATKWQEQ